MDFESEQLLKKFRQILFFVDFLLAAKLSKCYQMLLNGAKKVKTNHRRLLTRAASKHFLNADFMTLFHFYRQN